MKPKPSRASWIGWARFLGCVFLGVVFLVAGATKAVDPGRFYVTLPDYGITGLASTVIALTVPAIEIGLGIALVLRWRIRRASALAALFMGGFVAIIAWGWWRGTLEECGCFGAMLERSPGEAIAIDTALFVLALTIWRGSHGEQDTGDGPFRWRRVVPFAAAGITLAATLWLFFAVATGVGATITAAPHPDMTSVDLFVGDHLLYLFHPDCPQCAKMSPRVARYRGEATLPPVVGFTTLTTRETVDAYREKHELDVPVEILSRTSLARITGDGSVPQLVHVRNGRILHTWVIELPEPEELREFLAIEGAGDQEPRPSPRAISPLSATLRNRSALATTDTEDRLIAALAIIGLRSSPNTGYRAPVSCGRSRTRSPALS